MEDYAYSDPYGWWGYHWSPPTPLSVVQLIRAGSLDAPLAALLWLLIEHRASLLVAAEPPLAGKTTTVTALLDFLPPGTRKVFLRGWYETFDFVKHTEPFQTCLLCNEISDHLLVYLWGPNATRAFELLSQGYALAATMHADSLEEVIGILEGEPLRVPRSWLARLTLVMILRVVSANGRVLRRTHTVHLLQPGKESQSLAISCLAEWEPAGDSFRHFTAPHLKDLGRVAGMGTRQLAAELARRESFLEGLARQGIASIPAFRKALSQYAKKPKNKP